jgi:hypothetical protein
MITGLAWLRPGTKRGATTVEAANLLPAGARLTSGVTGATRRWRAPQLWSGSITANTTMGQINNRRSRTRGAAVAAPRAGRADQTMRGGTAGSLFPDEVPSRL